MSPLLYLLSSNELKPVLFADVVSLLCSHHCKLIAQVAMQEAVTRVAEQSRNHTMMVNAEMCEVVKGNACS